MYTQNVPTLVKEIGLLAIVASALIGANYASGAWSNPTAAPPGNNADLPLNVGAVTQVKNGDLILSNTFPVLELLETDAQGSRLVNSNSALYMQFNRGSVASPSWATGLRISSPDSSFGQAVRAYGQMRAPEYCDSNGNNCSTPAVLASASGGLGNGQTWQTPSRSAHTSYRNTTGQPIMVAISQDILPSNAGQTDFEVSTNGSTWVRVARSRYSENAYFSIVVPDDHYYRLRPTVSFIGTWAELR